MLNIRKLALPAAVVLLMSACAANNPNTPPAQDMSPPTQVTTPKAAGDRFLDANVKIKSTITDTALAVHQQVEFEIYVDADGDGKGMIGIGNEVFDVVAVSDVIYIKLDEGTFVAVTDITAHAIFTATDPSGQEDLVSLGFRLVDDNPVSYSAKSGNITLSTKFANSQHTFQKQSVSPRVTLSFHDALIYIKDYITDVSDSGVSADSDSESDAEFNVSDFYLSSPYGVSIEGKTYSVGDTANPDTYFFGRTPEGLLYSSRYKEDTRVDFLHASYLSEDGRTSFTVTSNYVQGICTTANWEFLGFHRGQDLKEAQKLLGYKLSKSEQETWEPVDENMVFETYKDGVLYCKIGALCIELRSKTNALSEIYIYQSLAFVS